MHMQKPETLRAKEDSVKRKEEERRYKHKRKDKKGTTALMNLYRYAYNFIWLNILSHSIIIWLKYGMLEWSR